MPPALLPTLALDTLRAVSTDRLTQRFGPYLAYIHPTSDIPWNSGVVLDPSIPATDADLAHHLPSLREFLRDHRHTLRLEFFADLHPTLAPILERSGLRRDHAMPLMAVTPATFRPFAAPGVSITQLTADASDQDLAAFSTMIFAAFQEDHTVTPQRIGEIRSNLRANRCTTFLAHIAGHLAGAASMSVTNHELVGVATLSQFRRRGIATTTSSAAISHHFAQNHPHTWLSAATDAALRTYTKLGFSIIGTQLNYADPTSSSHK